MGYFPAGDYFARVTLTGAMLGTSSPFSVRSIDCHVKEFLSMGVRILVAVTSSPSACTPVASWTQRLPSQDHSASPNPPSLSKTHDLKFPVRGFLPMSCMPAIPPSLFLIV